VLTRIVKHKHGDVDRVSAEMISDLVQICADNILRETMIIDLHICEDEDALHLFEKTRLEDLHKLYPKTEMISRMEPSVTGQYFLSSFSSLDFGVPQIVIVNDISKKRYSRKGLTGLIAHEVGHLKDWFERGVLTSFVTSVGPDFVHFHETLELLGDQEIRDVIFKTAMASEEHLASEYAISNGYHSEIFEYLISNIETNIRFQELANEPILKELKEMRKKINIKKVYQHQLAGTTTYLPAIAEVCSLLENQLSLKLEKDCVNKAFTKLTQTTTTRFLRRSVLSLYQKSIEQPTIFHSRELICESVSALWQDMRSFCEDELFD